VGEDGLGRREGRRRGRDAERGGRGDEARVGGGGGGVGEEVQRSHILRRREHRAWARTGTNSVTTRRAAAATKRLSTSQSGRGRDGARSGLAGCGGREDSGRVGGPEADDGAGEAQDAPRHFLGREPRHRLSVDLQEEVIDAHTIRLRRALHPKQVIVWCQRQGGEKKAGCLGPMRTFSRRPVMRK